MKVLLHQYYLQLCLTVLHDADDNSLEARSAAIKSNDLKEMPIPCQGTNF